MLRQHDWLCCESQNYMICSRQSIVLNSCTSCGANCTRRKCHHDDDHELKADLSTLEVQCRGPLLSRWQVQGGAADTDWRLCNGHKATQGCASSSLENGLSTTVAAGLAGVVGTGQLPPDMGVKAAWVAPGELPPALHLCSTWCSRCLAQCRSACADKAAV